RIVELVALHESYLQALAAWGLRDAIPYGRGVSMLFSGPPGSGKTLTARAVAHQLGRRLLLVDTARLSGADRGFQQNLENLLREARLQNAVLFFDECEGLFAAQNRMGGGGQLSALLQALEQFEGVVILATNLPQLLDPALDRRILYRVVFQIPSPSMREAIWEVHMPPDLPRADDVDLHYIAKRFEFTGGYVKNAVLLAAGAAAGRAAMGEGPAAVTQKDLIDSCYSQLRHRLNELADRDVADLRLEDLILPDDIKQQVREIIEAVSAQGTVFREWGFAKKFNKGRGLSALFDGEPGTGKTLAAEVIAAELALGLYRVNVANVVSKYIGETEKNLTRIFAEARGTQSILLFDEADSLFAKRVEVKGSNDRFANMETNVLLQLIERYDGLVILTTNLKTSIDNAFERRLSFKINFPFPEWETRATIWEHLLPDTAPLGKDVDYDLLGKSFELSGGSIKNAVLRAAYRAAALGSPLTMDLFEDAAKRECQAAGKLFRVARREDVW
ncbi:MAG: ATP-binding protein, partial [Myxococcales bacterium]|nr:ATP-binding protein [Myxococcales bacterium]